MKRLLLSVLLLTGIGVGGALLVDLFTSDETRIRRRLDAMVAGFNAPDVGDCASGLAEGLSVSGPRGGPAISRDEVVQFLRYLALTKKDARGRYNLSVSLEEPHLRIEIHEGDPKTATVTLRAHFRETNGESVSSEAIVDIDAELIEDAEEGWQVRAADWKLVEGKMPF